ncbi:MAG TPA: hypothetical protein VI977_01435 [archaeon]|nr:hypothetical protein [archaeon]
MKAVLLKSIGKKDLEKTFGYSATAGILACFVFALVLEDLVAAIAFGFAFFATAFMAQLFLPLLREKQRAELIERDLPFALMSVSIDLDLNIAFEKCILNAAKGNSEIAKEFRRIFSDIREKGQSTQQAMLAFSQRTKSTAVKRAVLQLNGFYEQGSGSNEKERGSSEAVRRLALELLAKQRSESKAFSGKLVVFSLIFIAFSAIVPALFQSFAIVGSIVLAMELTPMQILVAVTIGFPLLDLMVLFFIRAKTPACLRG